MKNKIGIWLNKIIFIVTIIIFLCLVVFVIKGQGYPVEYNYNDINTSITTWQEETIRQNFTSKVNNLNKMEFVIASGQEQLEKKNLSLIILNDNNSIIREVTITTDILEDKVIEFDFDPIYNSYGEDYTISLSCFDCTNNEKIAFYGNVNETNQTSLNFKVVGQNFYNKSIKWCSIIIFILTFYLFATNMSIIKNKFHKILKYFDNNIIFFIIEFILSISWVLLLFSLIIQFYYSFIFNKFIYILFFLLSELLVFMFAYKLNKKIKPEEFFLLLAIPIGLCFFLFMVPSEVADENNHYASAYNFAKGNIIYNKNYAYIPKIIKAKGHPHQTNYEELIELLKTPEDTNEVELVTSGYNILGYIPSTIGIFIGNILNMPYFLEYYLARLLTFICVLIFIYIAIKLIPIGKLLLTIYCLNPMFLHQSASISLDAMLNMFILLFISYTLYLAHNKKELTKKNIIILFILMICIAGLKYIYIPIFLILLILIYKKEITKKEKITISLCVILAILFDIICYILHVLTPVDIVSDYILNSNVNVLEQIKYLLNSPIEILIVLKNTFVTYGSEYLEGFLGMNLGWLDIDVNKIFGYIYATLLFISPFLIKEKENYTKLEKKVMFIIFIILVLAIIFVMYLTWSDVGALSSFGVQGRYFIPAVILVLLPLCDKERFLKFKNPYLICMIVLFIVHYNVIATIINTFI